MVLQSHNVWAFDFEYVQFNHTSLNSNTGMIGCGCGTSAEPEIFTKYMFFKVCWFDYKPSSLDSERLLLAWKDF